MNFYKHHIGDYDSHTNHLTWDEDMAYTRLLRVYYSREAPIPLDPGTVFRLVRATCRSAKEAVTRVLHEFFIEKPDGWHNKRCDEEIKSYQAQALTNRRIARQRFVNGSSTKRIPNHKPITNNQEPYIEEVALLPDWLPQEAWKAWLEMRRQKKTPNTPRALKLAITELTRLRSLGHDPSAVLDQSVLKGWKSVFPLSAAALPAPEPKSQLCDYCERSSVGTTNGRRHCSLHSDNAMDNEKPQKPVLVQAKAVAG